MREIPSPPTMPPPPRRPPGRPAKTPQPLRVPAPAAVFEAGGCKLAVWIDTGRWKVSVDGVLVDRWFSTQVDAWEAGVAEADRLQRSPVTPR
jgi:hypothetical protein